MVLDQRAAYVELPGKLISVPIAAGVRIFDGALVAISLAGATDGQAVNWFDPTVGQNLFLGLARITDQPGITAAEGESLLGNTAQTVDVSADISGVILKDVAVAGSSATSLGQEAFSSDENTFTVTATPGNRGIGWISRFAGSGICDVKLYPADSFRSGEI